MSDDFAVKASWYYGDIYTAVRDGEMTFPDAIAKIPPVIFELTVGTPSRTGTAIERHAPLSPRNPYLPMYRVMSMAYAVITLTDTVRGMTNTRYMYIAIECHWRELMGFISSAVSTDTPPFWIRALVLNEDHENLVIHAIRAGKKACGRFGNGRLWPLDAQEAHLSTEMIVRKFQSLCELARTLPSVARDDQV